MQMPPQRECRETMQIAEDDIYSLLGCSHPARRLPDLVDCACPARMAGLASQHQQNDSRESRSQQGAAVAGQVNQVVFELQAVIQRVSEPVGPMG